MVWVVPFGQPRLVSRGSEGPRVPDGAAKRIWDRDILASRHLGAKLFSR